METLPPELHLMIFQFLSIPDTIRLRLVSKNWNRLLNCLKHESLVVHDRDLKRMTGYLKSDELPDILEFQPADSVVCRDENLLLTTPLSAMFQSVRKLKTTFYSRILQMNKFYNQFKELEELNCFHFSSWWNSMTIVLNLPRLNKLIVRKADCSRFDLRTPCLTHIEIISFGQCDLYYPEKLKRLEGNLYDHNEIDFAKLTNLEILIVNGYDPTFITNSFLAKMKSLKEVHFKASTWETRETMNLNYRRNGLKLYHLGFDIDKPIEVPEEGPFSFSIDRETRMISRNYEMTAETVYNWVYIDYNVLIETGPKMGFSTKFPRLAFLTVNGSVDDEDALLEFLMETKPPTFRMENHLLSQTFLNRLALQCNSIREIILKNLRLDLNGSEIQFIFKMKNLAKIKIIPLQVCLEFVIKAFEYLEQLTEIHWSTDDYRYGGYFFSTHTLSLGLDFEDSNQHLYTTIRSISKPKLLDILRSLLRELKPDKRDDIREIIYLVENYSNNELAVEDVVKKLVRNELYYIYC